MVLTTGRTFGSVQGTLRELFLHGQMDEYVISYSGGILTENAGNRILRIHALPFDEAEALWVRGVEMGVTMHAYTADRVYVHPLTENKRAYQGRRMEIEEVSHADLEFLRGQEVIKVLYHSLDVPYLQHVERQVADLTRNMDVSYSSNRYLEFNPAGVNKSARLTELATIVGVPLEETIAVGDNADDLSMIRAAGLGAAVANATDEVKAAADVVLESTCDENPMTEVIERFVLAQEGKEGNPSWQRHC